MQGEHGVVAAVQAEAAADVGPRGALAETAQGVNHDVPDEMHAILRDALLAQVFQAGGFADEEFVGEMVGQNAD